MRFVHCVCAEETRFVTLKFFVIMLFILIIYKILKFAKMLLFIFSICIVYLSFFKSETSPNFFASDQRNIAN